MREILHSVSILDMHARPRDYYASVFDPSIAPNDASFTASGLTFLHEILSCFHPSSIAYHVFF